MLLCGLVQSWQKFLPSIHIEEEIVTKVVQIEVISTAQVCLLRTGKVGICVIGQVVETAQWDVGFPYKKGDIHPVLISEGGTKSIPCVGDRVEVTKKLDGGDSDIGVYLVYQR